jgi:bifunctional DNA-binding transcriptional regulator/antitoxin component of YhaV-PrlF toxin-antitoxin module
MKQTFQKILSGRRISLPVKWMKENNLKIGDWVLIYFKERHIEIVPAMVVEK